MGARMDASVDVIAGFLEAVHPYDSLPRDELVRVAGSFGRRDLPAGSLVYAHGEELEGLYLIRSGEVEVRDPAGSLVSLLGPRNSFGERGLMRDGRAATSARTRKDSVLLLLPAAEFHRLFDAYDAFARFFTRGRAASAAAAETRAADFASQKVEALMARAPVSCTLNTSIKEAARQMREAQVSSLGVVEEGRLVGIVTTRDLSNRALAEGLSGETPVAQVMTADPVSLPPHALGSDVLQLMMERRIGHLPVVEQGNFVGMITQTDLTRFQAVSCAQLIGDVAAARTPEDLPAISARIPELLGQLVAAHNAHDVVTRRITDVTDAITRRLLAMAEESLGPPPVPYLWLACGSQGRQEQCGVSDQDNCLILDDAVDEEAMTYFAELARFVCDGLDACGYSYCPGEMMATNPRWCQPRRVWRDYFAGWVDEPDPMAQMLSSVMFDLRPIGGEQALFANLQAETLEMASANSIFVAHMVANSLKHTPPLGMFRGFATIRSGEHKNQLDLKHNGVVPVVDLARIYAIQGRLAPVNTRARLTAAQAGEVISEAGARDLIEAYDLIATTRLEHQAAQVKAGVPPDNFLAPAALSDFERSHLRDAFVVVRTMQSALGHGRSTVR